MRCRRAQTLLFERELAALPPTIGRELQAHVADCAECALHARAEQGLTADLVSLRVEVPLPVDVSMRVLAGLEQAGAPSGVEVSVRQLGWAATLAAVGATAVLAGMARILPQIQGAAKDSWTLAGGLGQLAASLTGAASAVLAAAGRTLVAVAEPIGTLLAPLQGLEPVAIAALTFSAGVMAGTVVLVVGRDLRGGGWIRKEG